MDLPEEFYQLIILIIIVAVAMTLVAYLTKSGGNFRNRRNRKARKQF